MSLPNQPNAFAMQDLARQLSQAGMLQDAAGVKASTFAQLRERLPSGQQDDAAASPVAVFVPGRIELLGKHTDYAGGLSMTVAAEQGFCMAARPRDDAWLTIMDVSTGESVRFPMAPDLTPPLGCWSNYPMTVARRLARNFPGIATGADIVFLSDLPRAAGMSSSSALMVAVYLVLAEINCLSDRDEHRRTILNQSDLAAYLATIENGRSFGPLEGDLGVGTLGGSEDHTAILWSEAGQIGQYSYCPVTLEKRFTVPADCMFAIGVSGVVAEKTGAARERYNTASRLASTLLDIWRQATGRTDPTLAAALHSGPDAAERLKQRLQTDCREGFDPSALETRLQHFLVENDKVIPHAGEALDSDDRAAFGHWVDRSQEATEKLLGNQVPQTVYLAAEARRQHAVAASAFGAGFGGSVWAMIERDKASEFLPAWEAQYHTAFPENAAASQFFLTGAGPAAFFVEL